VSCRVVSCRVVSCRVVSCRYFVYASWLLALEYSRRTCVAVSDRPPSDSEGLPLEQASTTLRRQARTGSADAHRFQPSRPHNWQFDIGFWARSRHAQSHQDHRSVCELNRSRSLRPCATFPLERDVHRRSVDVWLSMRAIVLSSLWAAFARVDTAVRCFCSHDTHTDNSIERTPSLRARKRRHGR
jgi:hypothetical protein